ncbi:hypothetical protein [Gluconobacter oxydans]|uniref:hypothetical protein n=1 Tax=Gluconobacter oxydans TaxID=442 RepID=UPI001559C461|nr:hypothetical protein [Gluconobacter oxydans]
MPAALKTTILRNGPFIVFLVIATVWMNTRINRSIFIDNDMFRHALDHTSLLSFLHTRYMTWSGRIFIEGALAETIRYPLFWRALIPFCAILLAYAIWSCTLRPALRPGVGIPLVMGVMLLNILLMLPFGPGLQKMLAALRCDRFIYDLNWVYLNTYVVFFLTLCMIVSILWCALSLKDSLTVLSFLLGGFAVTFLTGLSPTIYASSHRILLVMELGLVVYVCALIEALFTQLRGAPCSAPASPRSVINRLMV